MKVTLFKDGPQSWGEIDNNTSPGCHPVYMTSLHSFPAATLAEIAEIVEQYDLPTDYEIRIIQIA